MNLFHPSQPPVDPRALLDEHGLELFAETLRVGGRYVCQERPLKALSKSLRRRKPLYVAGKRGTGKTALALALAKACNLPYKRLQCMDDLSTGDMLYAFDTAAQNQYVAQRMAGGISLEQARGEQWGASS
jgi:MoxR-like ATPase